MSGVVIIGAGGQGRLIADALISQSITVHGFIDPHFDVGSVIGGIPVLGDDSWLKNNTGLRVAVGIGATRSITQRRSLYERLANFEVVGCIHNSTITGTAVQIHSSAQIMANCLINHSSEIQENVVVHSGSIVEHDAIIGAHSYLSPRVTLCGSVRIEEGVFVGASSTIIQNVSVGHGAVIAAGSVVTRNVLPKTLVMGVPARIVESLE